MLFYCCGEKPRAFHHAPCPVSFGQLGCANHEQKDYFPRKCSISVQISSHGVGWGLQEPLCRRFWLVSEYKLHAPGCQPSTREATLCPGLACAQPPRWPRAEGKRQGQGCSGAMHGDRDRVGLAVLNSGLSPQPHCRPCCSTQSCPALQHYLKKPSPRNLGTPKAFFFFFLFYFCSNKTKILEHFVS